MRELSRNFIQMRANLAVAGVDTVIRRDLDGFAERVKLWQIDEAHHVLEDNKWGAAIKMFPNAQGIGWTATPLRADKRGLGDVFDDLIVGPNMRELIDRGFSIRLQTVWTTTAR